MSTVAAIVFLAKYPHSSSAVRHVSKNAQEETLAAVPFTCRLTAAYRWIEHTRAVDPVLRDDLAQRLAGRKALQLAADEWAALQADQGTHRHFRVPARSRIIDDVLLSLTSTGTPPGQSMGPTGTTRSTCAPASSTGYTNAAATTFQVVSLGAGMDTRPWRLPLGRHVHCFEVDHADVIQLKATLLRSAGAATCSSAPPPPTPPQSSPAAPAPTYPLRCGTWAACGADLTSADLAHLLHSAGFSPAVPTVWIAEGLVYYLPLAESTAMLAAIAGMSAPGSHLLATCIDRVLWETHKTAQHAFANLWHFCVDDLVVAGRVRGTPWLVHGAPRATSALLREWYGKEVYQPLVYQGHEEFLVAALR